MIPLCRHVKTNGCTCHSPALHSSVYCYFHARQHAQARRLRSSEGTLDPPRLTLPPLEDHAAILYALNEVVHEIVMNRIPCDRARVLLNILQLATTVASQVARNAPSPSEMVRELVPADDGELLAPRAWLLDPSPQTLKPLGRIDIYTFQFGFSLLQ